jgi:hypothetical protein
LPKVNFYTIEYRTDPQELFRLVEVVLLDETLLANPKCTDNLYFITSMETSIEYGTVHHFGQVMHYPTGSKLVAMAFSDMDSG